MIALDHVVIAARTLAEGCDFLEAQFNTNLAPGGQHLGFGTHNRLLKLGPSCYLELIALDPEQPNPAKKPLFGLGTVEMASTLAQGPKLIAWAASTTGLNSTLDSNEINLFGEPISMQRGSLRWLITHRADGAALPDYLPTLIDWQDAAHPCTRLPDSPIELTRLTVKTRGAALQWFEGKLNDNTVKIEPCNNQEPMLTLEFNAGSQTGVITSRSLTS